MDNHSIVSRQSTFAWVRDTDWHEVWQSTRLLLVVWAVAVWVLLILLPNIMQMHDLHGVTHYLPYVVMGLGLVGAVLAAHSLRLDGHLLWFVGVLLLLAGWM